MDSSAISEPGLPHTPFPPAPPFLGSPRACPFLGRLVFFQLRATLTTLVPLVTPSLDPCLISLLAFFLTLWSMAISPADLKWSELPAALPLANFSSTEVPSTSNSCSMARRGKGLEIFLQRKFIQDL
uniref:Uncharacterized protein n=1 Tax=Cacopsylla melanoneura TaxID=428564 RepID=A0A8D8VU30_9HEMI